tara:strand:- start:1635 stop:2006 length:372 start_codon:yes stop_codon:yes gene_type:complete
MLDMPVNELERCKPWIEAALEYSGGTHTFDDVKENIIKGIMQLWPSPRGCIVTEIVIYPRKRVLNVFLAGGELDQILDMDSDVKAWAKAQGCVEARMSGRVGWQKPLKSLGWKPLFNVMGKEL